ncbi:MAG: hypothetical protein RQ885_12845 [Desulfurococcales archaeon]|nr:hypothetical protein [Desulfurococcales archaeon]
MRGQRSPRSLSSRTPGSKNNITKKLISIAVKALAGSEVYSKISRSMKDEDYAWQAVLYRGILYAQSILDLEKPVLIRVDPPRDKRERLRALLEGKRVTIKRRTYRIEGLLKGD